jgi:hypothetical protein
MHRTSHLALLKRCPPGSRVSRIDAIVVPTARPVSFLGPAVELARELACPILILCSGKSRASEVAIRSGTESGAAATIWSTPEHPLLDLTTQRPHTSLAQPYVDTGNKRNVGLMVARMLGWRQVLFLDDDIFGLRAAEVGRAAAVVASGHFDAVGWRYREFPDNSVVCHARRSVGHDQAVFLGAGALLVNTTGAVPFFPSVYNEDWLFWHDFAVHRRLGDAGGAVQQLRFNPFADGRRAEQEEFGDILAEGLYALIHGRRSVLVGGEPGYWDGVLAGRRAVLVDVENRLAERARGGAAQTEDGYEIAQVLRSVSAAARTLSSLTAQDFAEFVRAWQRDLTRWNTLLPELPTFGRISDALEFLKVPEIHILGEG